MGCSRPSDVIDNRLECDSGKGFFVMSLFRQALSCIEGGVCETLYFTVTTEAHQLVVSE